MSVRNWVKKKFLYDIATTHSSYANEHHSTSNERLEYLGDSVLNFVVSDYLYSLNIGESEMSSKRAHIVSEASLCNAIDMTDFVKELRVGKSIKDKNKISSIKADFFEAILGAIYLSSGIKKAKLFVHKYLIDKVVILQDYKTLLQEYAQNKHIPLQYITSQNSTKNTKFCAKVILNGAEYGIGYGDSIKKAEFDAAQKTMDILRRNKQ